MFFRDGAAIGVHEESPGSGKNSVGSYTSGTTYKIAIVLRTTGAYWLIKGGAYLNWTLLWMGEVRNDATVYPVLNNYNGTWTCDFIGIPRLTWLPTAAAFDSFSRDNGTLGNSEVCGPDGQSTTQAAWNNQIGTLEVVSNQAGATALSGGRAIATLDMGKADVLVMAKLTRSGGLVGIVLRYVDADNYIYALHNGTNAQLIKRVASSETTLINYATAYAAGAYIGVHIDGNAFRLSYNDWNAGTTSINDSVFNNTTKHG